MEQPRYFYLVGVASMRHSKEAVFTYHASHLLPVGAFVYVPLGRAKAVGVVLQSTTPPTFPTKEILTHLHPQSTWPAELIKLARWISGYYASHFGVTLQTMLPPGLQKRRRKDSPTIVAPKRDKKSFSLTEDQNNALHHILDQHAAKDAFLLHGVPGSGKTQVYIEASKQVVAKGKSVIVLVPEIALTTQLIAEFSNYFSSVVVIHSGMTEAERHQVWTHILENPTPLIVIGPRSALFSPLKNIGLIIVDECHEQSFKQDRMPRYHAIYAASYLAKLHQAKLLLGSATPNVSELYLAQQGKISLLSLPTAIQPHHNDVQIVAHKDRAGYSKHRFISDRLLAAITKSLQRKEQTLIFHNRRGTTPMVICENCGWQATCPHCDFPLTYHQDRLELRCHSCNFSTPIPRLCPECGSPTILFKGIGTKLIESELKKLFPNARIARFDTDNAKEEQLQSRYQELYEGRIDILVGTQIVAKGLDLPQISTVGVLQADAGLFLPDFTARERNFQLLYQVSGRAGRHHKKGIVVFQTYHPEHEIINWAANHDFTSFCTHELLYRKNNKLPPFYFLLKLTYGAKKEQTAITAAKKVAQNISSKYPSLQVVGPAPAFREQQRGMYYWQIVLKSKQRASLQKVVASLPPKWTWDLDPVSLL